MTAKMRSKPFRGDSRADWDDVRVKVMRWCLRAKLLNNWSSFSQLLMSTGDRPIVEDSSKDDYWGAKISERDQLSGRNVLGRLLMELREIVRADPSRLNELAPLDIPDFTLLGEQIPTLFKHHKQFDQKITHKEHNKLGNYAPDDAAEKTPQYRFL